MDPRIAGIGKDRAMIFNLYNLILLSMGFLALFLGIWVLLIGIRKKKTWYVLAGVFGMFFSIIGLLSVWVYKIN
jgi:hypothetical protein